MLTKIVMAPTASSPPYFCREELKHMLIRLSVAFITKGETPSAKTGQSTLKSILTARFFNLSVVFFPLKKIRAQRAETAWDITVAAAAPDTPQLKR